MSNVDYIRQRLAAYYTNIEVEMWLDTPHPQLNGQRPRECLYDERAGEVVAILDRLDAGAYL